MNDGCKSTKNASTSLIAVNNGYSTQSCLSTNHTRPIGGGR